MFGTLSQLISYFCSHKPFFNGPEIAEIAHFRMPRNKNILSAEMLNMLNVFLGGATQMLLSAVILNMLISLNVF